MSIKLMKPENTKSLITLITLIKVLLICGLIMTTFLFILDFIFDAAESNRYVHKLKAFETLEKTFEEGWSAGYEYRRTRAQRNSLKRALKKWKRRQ